MKMITNNAFRTIALIVIGLPVSIGVTNQLFASSESTRDALATLPNIEILQTNKNELTEACLRYRFTKGDSKLEREAKNAIDEHFDGEVLHAPVCAWILS